MKKVLGITLLGSIIATASASVVSCSVGISLDKILNRKNPNTKVLRELTNYSLANLNSATNNTSNDADIIANLQDVLLAVNNHDHYEGSLAEYWDHNSDKDYWKFRIRRNAFWTKIENNKQVKGPQITGQDIFNTFRYALNRNNTALTIEHFRTNFKYVTELLNFIDKLANPKHKAGQKDELYDAIFDKDVPGNLRERELSSSYFIDRAILAFNINPKDEKEAKRVALDTSKSTKQLAQESFQKGQIINNGRENGEKNKNANGLDSSIFDVGFHLSKKISYFESVISYLAFAPIPEIALQYAKDSGQDANIYAGSAYGKPLSRTAGYNGLWYSGPYVIEEYFPGSKLNLTKNEFYYNKEKVYIDKILYSFINKGDAATRRFLFETGDVSSTKINANDLAGWKKYVGKESDPVFEGTNIIKQKPTTVWAFAFNFNSKGTQIPETIKLDSKGKLVDSKRRTRTDEEDSILNRALALKSLRIMFRYGLNRSLYAKFYSEARDGQDHPVSSQLRNSFTSSYIATYEDTEHKVLPKDSNEKVADYTDFLAKDYYDIAKYDNNNKPINGNSLSSTISNTATSSNSSNNGTTNWEEKSWSDWMIEVLKNKSWYKEENIRSWANRFGKVKDQKNLDNKKRVSVYNEGNDAYLENDLLAFSAFLQDDQLQPKNNGTQDGLFDLKRDPKTVKFKDDKLAEQFANLIGVYDNGFDPNKDYQAQDSKLSTLYKKMNLLKQQVKKDLKDISGIESNNPITIPFLLNPAGSDDYKLKTRRMFEVFSFLTRKKDNNDIDSPFVFDIYQPVDESKYREEESQNKYGLSALGWGPDYDDPTNYLATIKYDGAYDYLQNWTTLFNKSALGNSSAGANGQSNNKNIKLELATEERDPSKKATLEKAYKNLKDSLQYFTNELTNVDENVQELYERYTKLAKLENFYTLSSAIIIPTHTTQADTLPVISYLDEFSKPTWPTGTHARRLVGVRMFDKIVTKKQFAEQKANYEKEKQNGYNSLYPMTYDEKSNKNVYFDKFTGSWTKQWKEQYEKTKKTK
ncbi:lipoprotein [Mycoplasma feriruminatoris]|uniref:oligopeptide ABC transporter substrate-binding protein OppA n=1 Tax=Mycoplasma feriruminatoris TaxID=1179777 RepID=UPI00241D4FB6|nr:oligopeptide ABC transporter substrate-binding protein OppA [Mycoplasma feriruminatoris]WFQ96248.1 lipoprotein [Mycoplasma feriruminatoris]